MDAKEIVKYLRHMAHDAHMAKTISDGELRKETVVLEAAEKIEEPNDFLNSQCAKLLAENARLRAERDKAVELSCEGCVGKSKNGRCAYWACQTCVRNINIKDHYHPKPKEAP
ncbi:MAG: hypothetical protein EOM66_03115 [Clostridia bacterium]|nr:hypothetical protein [Clostridia bacterium]